MKTSSIKQEDEKKLFAFLAAFLTIIGFIIALIVKRDDKYVIFYAKHGLVLFILQVIASVVDMLPVIGKIASVVMWIIFLILWVITWLNALSGTTKNTPVIGEMASKIKL